jgi:hypothetical protein
MISTIMLIDDAYIILGPKIIRMCIDATSCKIKKKGEKEYL